MTYKIKYCCDSYIKYHDHCKELPNKFNGKKRQDS